MNINALESVARLALKGEAATEKINAMLKSGLITAAEHRSLMVFRLQPVSVPVRSGTVAICDAPQRFWG